MQAWWHDHSNILVICFLHRLFNVGLWPGGNLHVQSADKPLQKVASNVLKKLATTNNVTWPPIARKVQHIAHQGLARKKLVALMPHLSSTRQHVHSAIHENSSKQTDDEFIARAALPA